MHKDKIYDVAIIGGGIAGIFAAMEALKNNLSVVLFEKGPAYENRVCKYYRKSRNNPKLREPNCKETSCLSGMGGIGLRYEVNLDNYNPSLDKNFRYSSSLLNVLEGRKRVEDMATKVYNLIIQTLKDNKKQKSMLNMNISYNRINYKNTGTVSLNFKEVNQLMEFFLSQLLNYDTCELKLFNEVKNIRKEKHHFKIEVQELLQSNAYKKSIQNKNKTYYANYITFSCGRFTDMCELMENIKIQKELEDYSEIGVRIELPRDYIQNISQIINQRINIKDDNGNIIYRIFCICDGGRIMRINYNSYFYIDGQHCNTVKTNKTNFAVLKRVYLKGKQNKKTLIHDLITKFNRNSISTQLYYDYINFKISSYEMIQDTHPTYEKIFPANVSRIMKEFDFDLKYFMSKIEMSIGKSIPKDTLVAGPVIEHNNPKMVINKSFMSTIKGLYLIGDCSGRISGVISAAISGLCAIEDIMVKKNVR